MANCAQCGRKLPGLTFGKKLCQWCLQHEAAKRGDIAEDARQPVVSAPWVRRRESSISLTQILFGINIAVFLALALASGAVMDFPGQTMLALGANYGPYTLTGQWWRLVTYMFLHGGLLHIAFNMWCLWDMGALAESLYGRWSFGAIYLITGVAGGIASVGWNPGVFTVGASGAIFGLAGALLASFYLGEFSMVSIAMRGTITSLAFFIVINILFGAGFNMFGGGSFAVDNAAHIGGLISGMILGALIARVAPQRDAPMRRFAVIAVVALGVLAAVLFVSRWRGTPMRLGLAIESMSENRPQDAVSQLQRLVRLQPNASVAHYALGQAYFSQQKYPQAESEFRRALELEPQQNGVRFALGLTYLDERRPAEAKSEFAQILAHDAGDPKAHYGMGMALAAEAQHQAAIEEFKSALRLGPEARGLYFDLGQSYFALKMYDEAIDAYTREKEKGTDDPEIELALADAYQAKGMTQNAEDARKKASELKSAQHE